MSENKIVFYHYPFSPYARRVLWYLALRNIDYTQCIQPPIMPRPDLAALGVSYRRIPVLALGRDIVCDTRLQLSALDSLVPPSAAHPSLAVHGPEAEAISRLFAKWSVEGGLFARASQLIPPSLPILNDPKFTRDREDFSGRSWKKEDLARARPEALLHVREAFDVYESLLGDGREWICRTAAPSAADIEAVWLPHWLSGMKGALDETFVSAELYPKTFAWIARFNGAVKERQTANGKPATLDGKAAAEVVLRAGYARSVRVQPADPLGLRHGELVEVWPTDSGMSHSDSGKLVGLDRLEVVVEKKAADRQTDVRIHFPRTLFRVKPTGKASL